MSNKLCIFIKLQVLFYNLFGVLAIAAAYLGMVSVLSSEKDAVQQLNNAYISETGEAFGVWLQEHRQEFSQCDLRPYTQNTSRSAAMEQNKSVVTDRAIFLNHVVH